jgi:hypothetical protein
MMTTSNAPTTRRDGTIIGVAVPPTPTGEDLHG